MNSIREFEYAGWQRAAPVYVSLFAGATRPYVESLLDAAHASSGAKLLDVACGPGFVAAKARERGVDAVGIDFSPEMIGVARALHAGVEYRLADADALPFADRSFHAVVANFGLHHFENPRKALSEFQRVLQPRGRLAFTIWVNPQENPAWKLILDAVGQNGRLDVPMPAGGIAPSVEGFVDMAGDAGFRADSVRAERIERIWQLPAGTDLVALFERSTVRTAAVLRGQSAEALSAIRNQVARELRNRSIDGVIEMPTRAFLVVADKH